ncbi:MAG: histidine phosphatase family protein [Verrucomicrobiaceae bacterium]|nr:histidine phosphatase family protein [Verrucomicrobiaceae bacterium]
MTIHLPDHPTRLYLIRHGEVEEAYHQVFGGSRIDMGLSPLGLRQGQAVAEAMSARPVDAVYSSPMLRVKQTMQPFLQVHGSQPIVMDGLREIDFGVWTGHRWPQVQETFGVSAYDWLEIMETTGIPEGETAQQLMERVAPCLQQILGDHPQQSVAVYCHGGIVRVILALLLEMPLARMAHFNIDYASITAVEIQPEKKHAVELDLLNWCPWRDADA